ncbi:HD domain-containing protein [Desulfobacca acetoxidans]|uniref:Polynucleotide adenylyltransferase/metal dependent phosphohydrolase n=1 Tax=Desulfobacca acetoxidans (strain ATCC 700848 / DSM 11109 / ASRB2) TaxID=880072 RepID=F2NF48_DESAR|nr:HD domain-containing protein [Desulfobacca acetoxidans]AEB08388.1 polynucleotide adenylyltransferase/metal dependent phosphohydrolase [Desulfobacca acetoxidans DSM 11109]
MKSYPPPPKELGGRLQVLGGAPMLQVLAKLAASRGLKVYLVGGAVRELLLGRETHDLDLAVDRQALEVGQELAQTIGGSYVLLDEREKSARVVWQGRELDLTEFRAPDLPGDLRKRDFTLNAMAIPLEELLDPSTPQIIDPWGGRADLTAGRLQLLLPENFLDDPLRLLRAFRFAATHGFDLSPQLRRVIQRYGPAIATAAGERQRQELFRLLSAPRAHPVLRLMDQLGFLGHLLPELEDMKGVAQDGYHHLDVFEHSLSTVCHLEELLAAPENYFQECASYVTTYSRQDKKAALLKLAALFHDVGKPLTRQFREDQRRYTFYHHERLGVEIFLQVAARLRFSQEESRTVARLIELHMRPFLLLPDYRQGKLSQRALGRFIKAARPELAGVFLLAMADSLGGQGPAKPPDSEAALAGFCDQVYVFLKERLEPLEQRPRLLTGDDLIRVLRLNPGPVFSKLLTAVEEAALAGEITSREEALELVRGLLADAMTGERENREGKAK